MSDEKEKSYRLAKVAKELNVGTTTLAEYLEKQGYKDINASNPNQKLTQDQYLALYKKFASEKNFKEKADSLKEQQKEQKERIQKSIKEEQKQELHKVEVEKPELKILGKIDLGEKKSKDKSKGIETPTLFDNPIVEENSNIHLENDNVKQHDVTKQENSEEQVLVFVKSKKDVVEPIQEDSSEVSSNSNQQETSEVHADVTEIANPETVIRAKDHTPKLTGTTVVGKIDLTQFNKGKDKNKKIEDKKTEDKKTEAKKVVENTERAADKKKRKRNRKPGTGTTTSSAGTNNNNKSALNKEKEKVNKVLKSKEAPDVKKVGEQVKKTFSNMNQGNKRLRQKLRRDKRDKQASKLEQHQLEMAERAKVLEVTEFLTANELAILMDVSVNEVIAKCMQLGLFVSINQRIDADVISLIAEEFGYSVEFVSVEENIAVNEEEDNEEDLEERPPIVTVMGHVDHGKTSLLDYIRKANVIAGEAGGITQHIGAYEVVLANGKRITFLDTPGHEAFTAMRARGAQVTDIAIIVIAADDQVMPQTIEAINHAQAAGVPMIFAINKIDKDGSDPTRIRQQLAEMNLLVEDWGGNYQVQEIAAKSGLNIDLLLEKVLIEAELLDLKANPNKNARGTVIEAKLDKGRGVVSTVLVQSGTLNVGDIIIANCHYGRVKAMYDERQKPVKKAGPSTPVQILGLSGVPQAGDKFAVLDTEKEARELATKRQQLLREQTIRTQKHITLDEIARRRAIGSFKELNLIVKGDVDGSVEALADSLLKLSTEEVAVKIIHKAVGQISESDVLLASSSEAIIIGFQVRPSASARKLAEHEQIDIRLYSIIYDAINEVRYAIEGLLEPKIEEKIIGTLEVLETFKIAKVGTVAGCLVTEGKIIKTNPVRIIRDGIVIHTAKIDSLKRFKNDVKEVDSTLECGISLVNYNDIKVGDIIESYEIIETKRKLS